MEKDKTYCINCVDGLSQLDRNSIDLVVTSCPYDYMRQYKGDLVLDPFVGSGTTVKVAKEMKRSFIGFDVSEEYCKIAEERVSAIH